MSHFPPYTPCCHHAKNPSSGKKKRGLLIDMQSKMLFLSSKTMLAGFGTVPFIKKFRCRGFKGPVPPPLLIRIGNMQLLFLFKLCFLIYSINRWLSMNFQNFLFTWLHKQKPKTFLYFFLCQSKQNGTVLKMSSNYFQNSQSYRSIFF